jgi:hypothetical protein
MRSLRSMDGLAAVNIVGVGSNGVLAILMVTLAAAARASGEAQPLPLWPHWKGLVAARGGALGEAGRGG